MTRVLVTGASGHIGRHVVAQLSARDYEVRAITSRSPRSQPQRAHVEWCQLDFQRSLDFLPLLEGCDAVIHLAAELDMEERMMRSNVEATRALAEASERVGVKVFCYTSSVAVYGSSKQRRITEDSPILTTETDVPDEYRADSTLRYYGRTKLMGEKAIHEVARSVEYIILRPTVVVDISDLVNLRDWSTIRKSLSAHRRTHHIYVEDVADAIIWFIDRGLARQEPGVSTYNLADDDDPTFGQFFRQAYVTGGDTRFRVLPLPWQVDELRALVSHRNISRHTFGRMIFSNDRLKATGYKPRFGMSYAISKALEGLRSRP